MDEFNQEKNTIEGKAIKTTCMFFRGKGESSQRSKHREEVIFSVNCNRKIKED